MDYKNNLKQFLKDFFKYDEDGKMYCSRLVKIDFTVHQVKEMVEMELKGKARPAALVKLHARYTKLRSEIERERLLDIRADWDTYLLKRKNKDVADQQKGIDYKIAS